MIAARSAPGGTITIAGRRVSRLGFGTMRLTGPGTWDHPADWLNAVAVLRQAVESGITHIDTADAYGPHVVEELVRTALHPYPDHVLIATKVGMVRPGPNVWRPLGRPDYLRAAVEASLRRLAVDTLGLCYLHRVDPAVPLADQVGELADLQREGKIAAVGLSKVTPEQIEEAGKVVPIAAVQNCLNRDEPFDPAVDYCRDRGIPFVAYRPLNAGALTADGGRDALRWLLSLGGHVATIPGTSSLSHLKELVNAAA